MLKKLITEIKATMGIYESDADDNYGMLAEFKDPGALYHAAHDVHHEGYRKFDTYSPFPIHGMDKAMGLGNSKVGFLTLGGGLTGLALATWLQWWVGAVEYPINVSGKPLFAFEPSIPVMFEVTILFAAIATVAGMFAMNGLPRPFNPLFYSERFQKATDDGFFLAVAANDTKFDLDETRSFLESMGAVHIEVIKDTPNA
jgi:Alternative complex III, ActD subunit